MTVFVQALAIFLNISCFKFSPGGYPYLAIGISFFTCPGFSVDVSSGSVKYAEYRNWSLSNNFVVLDPKAISLTCASGVFDMEYLNSIYIFYKFSFSECVHPRTNAKTVPGKELKTLCTSGKGNKTEMYKKIIFQYQLPN